MQDELPSCQEMFNSQEEYAERGLRDFLSCNTKLGPSQDHPHPKSKYTRKATPVLSALNQNTECESTESDSSPLKVTRPT